MAQPSEQPHGLFRVFERHPTDTATGSAQWTAGHDPEIVQQGHPKHLPVQARVIAGPHGVDGRHHRGGQAGVIHRREAIERVGEGRDQVDVVSAHQGAGLAPDEAVPHVRLKQARGLAAAGLVPQRNVVLGMHTGQALVHVALVLGQEAGMPGEFVRADGGQRTQPGVLHGRVLRRRHRRELQIPADAAAETNETFEKEKGLVFKKPILIGQVQTGMSAE